MAHLVSVLCSEKYFDVLYTMIVVRQNNGGVSAWWCKWHNFHVIFGQWLTHRVGIPLSLSIALDGCHFKRYRTPSPTLIIFKYDDSNTHSLTHQYEWTQLLRQHHDLAFSQHSVSWWWNQCQPPARGRVIHTRHEYSWQNYDRNWRRATNGRGAWPSWSRTNHHDDQMSTKIPVQDVWSSGTSNTL